MLYFGAIQPSNTQTAPNLRTPNAALARSLERNPPAPLGVSQFTGRFAVLNRDALALSSGSFSMACFLH
jgi:hypothetical protein